MDVVQGDGYAAVHAGPISNWEEFQFQHPALKRKAAGKHFLQEQLGLSGAEVSLNVFKPGQGMPFSHHHRQNEELYLFLTGRGEMTLDGATVAVSAGSCVKVAPSVVRCWRNTGSEDMSFVVVQYLQGSPVGPTTTDGVMDRAEPRHPTAAE